MNILTLSCAIIRGLFNTKCGYLHVVGLSAILTLRRRIGDFRMCLTVTTRKLFIDSRRVKAGLLMSYKIRNNIEQMLFHALSQLEVARYDTHHPLLFHTHLLHSQLYSALIHSGQSVRWPRRRLPPGEPV